MKAGLIPLLYDDIDSDDSESELCVTSNQLYCMLFL